MCGLIGWISPRADEALFRKALGLIAHRGPDGEGVFEGTAGASRVLLGHRRLAIIDLSAAGAQPMRSADGRFWIVFNGEIFNFQALRRELEREGVAFRSKSDTEVLLEAFARRGPRVFADLNGMFALAIFDTQTGEVTLARDHLGVKPLYYAQGADGLSFASEVKALLALGHAPRLRRELLGEYLAQSWVHEPDTLFEGINKLPAGHWARWREGRWHSEPFWDVKPGAPNGGQALERLEQLTREAVEMQLVADRPVGAYLSGGVDSSVIAHLAYGAMPQLVAVSARFSEEDRRYEGVGDDGRWADHFVGRHPGLRHHTFVLAPDHYDCYKRLVWNMDEPIADTAIVPAFLLAQEARRAGAVVMLSGMGADELFAGYRRYSAVQLQGFTDGLPRPVQRAGRALALGLQRFGNGPVRRRASHLERFLQASEVPWPTRYMSFIGHFGACEVDDLVGREWREPFTAKLTSVLDGFHEASLMAQAQRLDLKGFLASHNLIYSDKASMAASVEVRVPLLDYRLAELAFSLPEALRASRGRQKVLLKALCAKLVDPEIAYRPKAGFAMPARSWLRTSLRGEVERALGEGRVAEVCDRAALRRLLEGHYAGRAENTWKLWTLLTLDLWLERFGVEIGS
jgi:asparagine synthase (glutamine-hydrolysing)